MTEFLHSLFLDPDTGANPQGNAGGEPVAPVATPPVTPTPSPVIDMQEIARQEAEAALQGRLASYEADIAALRERLESLPTPTSQSPSTVDATDDDPVRAEFNEIKNAIKGLTETVSVIRDGWSKSAEAAQKEQVYRQLEGVRQSATQDVLEWVTKQVIPSDPDLAKAPDKGIAAALLADVKAYMASNFRPSLQPHEMARQAAIVKKLTVERMKELKSYFPTVAPEPVVDQVRSRDSAFKDNLTAPTGGTPVSPSVQPAAQGGVHWWRERLTEAHKRHGG